MSRPACMGSSPSRPSPAAASLRAASPASWRPSASRTPISAAAIDSPGGCPSASAVAPQAVPRGPASARSATAAAPSRRAADSPPDPSTRRQASSCRPCQNRHLASRSPAARRSSASDARAAPVSAVLSTDSAAGNTTVLDVRRAQMQQRSHDSGRVACSVREAAAFLERCAGAGQPAPVHQQAAQRELRPGLVGHPLPAMEASDAPAEQPLGGGVPAAFDQPCSLGQDGQGLAVRGIQGRTGLARARSGFADGTRSGAGRRESIRRLIGANAEQSPERDGKRPGPAARAPYRLVDSQRGLSRVDARAEHAAAQQLGPHGPEHDARGADNRQARAHDSMRAASSRVEPREETRDAGPVLRRRSRTGRIEDDDMAVAQRGAERRGVEPRREGGALCAEHARHRDEPGGPRLTRNRRIQCPQTGPPRRVNPHQPRAGLRRGGDRLQDRLEFVAPADERAHRGRAAAASRGRGDRLRLGEDDAVERFRDERCVRRGLAPATLAPVL